MSIIKDYPNEKWDFEIGTDSVTEGEKVVFNSFYGNDTEGQIGRVTEYNMGSYTISGFDPNYQHSSMRVKRGTFFTIEDLSKKYLEMKSTIEKMIEKGVFSLEEYQNTLSEQLSKNNEQMKR